MESNVLDSLNKIYGNRGYFDLYGADLLIAFVIIYVLLLGTTYFYILTHKKSIEMDWPEKRCNPLYLPFAGFIVKDKNKSILESTGENFHHCANNILVTIANDAFAPIYYIFNILINTFSEISTSVNSVRGMFNKIRTEIGETASSISNRTLNVSMPIVEQAIHSRDSLSRIHGIATTAVYQLFGLFITTFSLFKFFKDVLVGLLIIMAAAIIALWVVAYFFWPAAAAAGAATALYIAILVPFLIVIILISNIFKYNGGQSPPSIPGKSSCFDKNTLIEMNDGNKKKINEIKIGDILKDNNRVTATMKSTIGDNKMYRINNILVTGCHKILIDGNWINVDKYKNSSLINDYSEEFVYCLNTESKLINIDDFIFMDWDELDFNEIKILEKKYKYNINKIFNNGLCGNTKIITNNGDKLLKDIKVGDNLGDDNYVLATINVLSKDLHIINKDIDDKNIILTLNLIDDISFSIDDKVECKQLYQLKTSNGYYYIDSLKINDYDSLIEKILQ